jgi:hypothetical protein
VRCSDLHLTRMMREGKLIHEEYQTRWVAQLI